MQVIILAYSFKACNIILKMTTKEAKKITEQKAQKMKYGLKDFPMNKEKAIEMVHNITECHEYHNKVLLENARIVFEILLNIYFDNQKNKIISASEIAEVLKGVSTLELAMSLYNEIDESCNYKQDIRAFMLERFNFDMEKDNKDELSENELYQFNGGLGYIACQFGDVKSQIDRDIYALKNESAGRDI